MSQNRRQPSTPSFRPEFIFPIALIVLLVLLFGLSRLRGRNPSESAFSNNAQSETQAQGQSAQPQSQAQPVQSQQSGGEFFQIIPDSELVYGPFHQDWDVFEAVSAESFLGKYTETVEGTQLTGPQIVNLVAERTRVSPRLLITALEFRGGWLTKANIADDGYPMGYFSGSAGLYNQLEWAANQLNRGYYSRTEANVSTITIADGSSVGIDTGVNPGTLGVLSWLGAHTGATQSTWRSEAQTDGFLATYVKLFGDPNTWASEPDNRPTDQPTLTLPWSNSETWYFTGGPHGGWINGSAWAALDFITSENQFGCYSSNAWVTAVADGVITRSDFGAVVLDLDGDGYTGTGWAILYQHIETRDRIAVGTRVQTGDAIGHPSCEGGYSSGTHLHIARLYNGRWVSADQSPAFNLGGWQAEGSGDEYNGSLNRNGVSKVATVGRVESNAISANP